MTHRNSAPHIVLLFAILLTAGFDSGCARNDIAGTGESAANKNTLKADSLPVSGPIDEELARAAAASKTIKNIRESGILTARLLCDEPRLCERGKNGAVTGLEADLLKRIAAALGVKLNIVDGGKADIYGPGAGAPGSALQMEVPYFYSADGGWLHFAAAGDMAFEKTVSGILTGLYDTGTYQQLYRNHFAAEEEPF